MIQLRRMIRDDIAHGMRFKEQAGWNQVEPDWQRLFALQPDGAFLAECDGMPVGTVTTCRFGPVAWIAMMLVDEAFRGQGIGRRLMSRAIDDLDRHEVQSIRLDATPLGRPLYESLGFVPETTLIRFGGILRPADEVAALAPWNSTRPEEELMALDREVTGTDRGKLISRLIAEHGDSLRVVEDDRGVEGFLMTRPGSNARQIGPCLASDRAGRWLLADAGRRYAGEPVVIDIPTGHHQAIATVERLGLQPTRHLLRMGRGPRIAEDLSRLWASAGPEKG
ncbi:GNAT family N-acetyltransferase [Singulisphaera acidiphila]|uniref:Putative acyltransferase n=1 Tax=Singulisphaera acidiphila (strain ATCC BAA-1392 / DSM 18658 / VKM B-2454 / MOB10) TaxID=886293 RepID=L0DCY8_SINAD|nr:GNAT family N-acetyltransferase [Singulisphaera acidiphila]AGA26703.1 putative acyltransferase [Singulisphaera acidiphila DSM 18658]